VIVVIVQKPPAQLRGELTRWLLEVDTGVYVGTAAARVREHLWGRVRGEVGTGRALMIWSDKNEQRLSMLGHHYLWTVEDFDGLNLLRKETAESRKLSAYGQRSTMLDT